MSVVAIRCGGSHRLRQQSGSVGVGRTEKIVVALGEEICKLVLWSRGIRRDDTETDESITRHDISASGVQSTCCAVHRSYHPCQSRHFPLCFLQHRQWLRPPERQSSARSARWQDDHHSAAREPTYSLAKPYPVIHITVLTLMRPQTLFGECW